MSQLETGGVAGPAPAGSSVHRRPATALLAALAFCGLVAVDALLVDRAPALWAGLALVAPLPLALSVRLAPAWMGATASVALLAAASRMAPGPIAARLVLVGIPLLTAGLLLGRLTARGGGFGRVLALGASGVAIVLMVMFYTTDLYRLTQTWQPGPPEVRALGPIYEAITSEPLGEGHPDAAEGLRSTVAFWGKFPLFWMGLLGLALFGTSQVLAGPVMEMAGLPAPGLGEFARWTIPWTYSWWIIGAAAAFLAARLMDVEWGLAVTSNVCLVLLIPAALVTFSVISHVLERWAVDPPLRIVVFMLALVSLPYLTVACLFDPWLDFRNLLASPPSQEDGSQGE